MRIPNRPLSSGSDPVILTAMETLAFLMEVGFYTFPLKLMELLIILMAQVELW